MLGLKEHIEYQGTWLFKVKFCSHLGNCNLIGAAFNIIKMQTKLSIVTNFYMYSVKYFILKCSLTVISILWGHLSIYILQMRKLYLEKLITLPHKHLTSKWWSLASHQVRIWAFSHITKFWWASFVTEIIGESRKVYFSLIWKNRRNCG